MKKLINRLLSTAGYRISSRSSVILTDDLVEVLDFHNFLPRSVFDIGVGYGTPWLYEAFSEAKFYLVDPTKESLPHMLEWSKKLNAEVHNIALGRETGDLEITNRETILHSTLFKDITQPNIVGAYNVHVVPFDDVFSVFEGPALVKIDVEGAELMVLDGLVKSVHKIDVFIIETSLVTLYDGGSEFRDIVEFFHRHGFSFFDICGIKRKPYDRSLHQIDAVFVQDMSPLRVRRWS